MLRPNARRHDTRARAASRKTGPYILPPVVQSRIAEAGASAYAWRDTVLADLYAPPRSVQVAARVASGVFQVLVALAVVVVAAQGGGGLVWATLAVPAAITALVWALTRTLCPPPALAWAAAAGVAAYPMFAGTPSWSAVGVVVLVAAAVVSAEPEHPIRGAASAWVSAILTTAATALHHTAPDQWWPAAVWVLGLILAQVPLCLVRRSFGSSRHRITPEDLRARVPDPPFRWQRLVEVLRRVPGVAYLASEVSSQSWFAQVLEDPPESVMAQARKKAAGAYGERKTGVFLLGLPRGRGVTILHDVALPGAREANIDHLVVSTNREGQPCVHVIDSKFYGPSRLPSKRHPHGQEPGEVTYSAASGGYVFRLGASTREIDQSIKTALWGAEMVQKVTSIEDVRVIMAIHNADVAPYLTFSQGGTRVDILSAWEVVDHIEAESPAVSRSWRDRLPGSPAGLLSPIQDAKLRQGFTAAVGNQPPMATAPLGRTRAAKQFMAEQAAQARGSAAQTSASRAPVRETVPEPVVPPAPAVQDPSEVFLAADRAFSGPVGEEWASDTPPRPPVAAAASAPERVEELWEQMRNSVPAPLDDVPGPYQRIVRGTPLTITGFDEERGPLARDVVAVTGVCSGAPGHLFLWYCSVEGWKRYEQTKTPMIISTIGIDSVVVRGEGEG